MCPLPRLVLLTEMLKQYRFFVPRMKTQRYKRPCEASHLIGTQSKLSSTARTGTHPTVVTFVAHTISEFRLVADLTHSTTWRHLVGIVGWGLLLGLLTQLADRLLVGFKIILEISAK